MILDNENKNPKVYQWIQDNTKNGKLDIVTGYFTIGALTYLSNKLNQEINQYRMILGDIVSRESKDERPLDLLNENISIEACFTLNKLAREAVAFLKQQKVEVKTLEPNFCHAKAYIHQRESKNPREHYYITGSSNLTEAGIGLRVNNNIELNIAGSGDSPQYDELVEWFNNLWKNTKTHSKKTILNEKGETEKIDFKEYLINEIQKIFKEYSPKEIYYKVLYELFADELLLEKSNPEFNRQIGRLENSAVYNILFEFQKKGVLSLIKMLQQYNGAILADAVGLGKTWSALAVMKFFQIQGYDVILLCPKKLESNWQKFLKNRFSRFEDDKFDYVVRFHTDLFEDRMNKDGITLNGYFQSDRPKLLVIDESHNLRNDKSQRYKFLVENILKKNDLIKVLMLSATPINNNLTDIRNQFKLMIKDNQNGFNETLGIKNIDYTFRSAQQAFNEWRELPNPVIADFIKSLPSNFFKLTDSLLVARTRKMIEGMQDGLEFPQKLPPTNIFITPKQIGNFDSFEELFDHFPPKLSGYQPSFYVNEVIEKSVLEDEKLRDMFLVKMMYILLVKRLESSWYSFKSTVEKIRDHHDNALKKIKEYKETKNDYESKNPDESIFDDDDMQDVLEELSLGKKRRVRLSDIDACCRLEEYKTDLKKDLDCLDNLKSNLKRFNLKIDNELKITNNHKSLDDKLAELIKRIKEKRASGKNNKNQKVLIFSVYKDTAFYLYNQLKARGFDKIAVISGDESKVYDSKESTKLFEPLLERFASYTKLFKEKEWKSFDVENGLTDNEKYEAWKLFVKENDATTYNKIENPIDILITTDVLSEGQNLQDCDFVVNYDIHWNPVRVIQRMGRIDRLGSPNETISGINFWPSDNINSYLNLQGRIEQRMAAMQLAGAEVDENFSTTFKQIAKDESLEQKQKERMLKQMQTTWDDIETGEQTFGFNDLSLEVFRQDLLDEIRKRENEYKFMPNGVYTGFKANENTCSENGIVAILGYPSKKNGNIKEFKYQNYDLIFVNNDGSGILMNQKEILDFLSIHKNNERKVPENIDKGEPETLLKLSQSIKNWLQKQSQEVEIMPDGTEKITMGKSAKDVLNKLKYGDKSALDKLKQNKTDKEVYLADNFDLIAWFNIIK